jgi:geranylgeranyl pyrophosphate synthase
MITRGFSFAGDVETAFEAVARSGGLEKTKELARRHCKEAVEAVAGLEESEYKWALLDVSHRVLDRKN